MGGRRSASAIVVATVLVMGVWVPPASGYPRPGKTRLISLTSDQTQVRWDEWDWLVTSCVNQCLGALSRNARYLAFETLAGGFDARDLNEVDDVYVRDRKRGTTELVSIAENGTMATGACYNASSIPSPDNPTLPFYIGSGRPSISDNGRYVVFQSCAANLVPNDQKVSMDVFVHDRRTGQNELISVSSNEQPGTCPTGGRCSLLGHHSTESISADGRYVVFFSEASNLVPGDTNAARDVFVRDRVKGTTERVSVATGGRESNCQACYAIEYDSAISANGRHVAFTSHSRDLVEGDVNDPRIPDVFVHDRKSNKTERVNVSSQGDQETLTDPLNYETRQIAISGTGRYVAFTSYSGVHVPYDKNNAFDIFVRDRTATRTERVSVTSQGTESEAPTMISSALSISANGRFVAFSTAAALVPGDDRYRCDGRFPGLNCHYPPEAQFNWAPDDVYVYDRATGEAQRMSLGANGSTKTCSRLGKIGQETCAATTNPMLSASGRYVSFYSNLDRLTTGDRNESYDFFLRDRGIEQGVGQIVLSGGRGPSQNLLLGRDDPGDAGLGIEAADLIEGSVAYRPRLRDLFVQIGLRRLSVLALAASPSRTVVEFTVDGVGYELRQTAGSVLEGSSRFELLRCADGCAAVASLPGTYGTTGEEIDVSLPLSELGVGHRVARIDNVRMSTETVWDVDASVLDSMRL